MPNTVLNNLVQSHAEPSAGSVTVNDVPEVVARVRGAIEVAMFMGRTSEDVARAAIEAMREPTDGMIDAGVKSRDEFLRKSRLSESKPLPEGTTIVVATHPAGTIYCAMIDAALGTAGR